MWLVFIDCYVIQWPNKNWIRLSLSSLSTSFLGKKNVTDLPDDEDLHIWGTFIKDVNGTLMMFISNRVNNDFSSLPRGCVQSSWG